MDTFGERRCDVAVVGGGLGGLATATLLARRGLEVEVLERATALGGRAATHEHQGFSFNEGAHALYRGGAAARVLGRIGVRWSGRRPPGGGLALLGGRCHPLPTTPGVLLTTSLLSWSAKMSGAKVMARLRSIDPRPLAGVSWSAWAEREVPDRTLRAMLETFVRVSTYANAPALVSAGATIEQLRLSSGAGVDYLDGGWGSLVHASADAARDAGAQVRAGVRALCAGQDGAGWTLSTDTERVRCRALVIATGPAAARSIVPSEWLAQAAFAAIPAKAACLDVALSRLPDPEATFVLGVDRPLYLSVHSRTARVAPPGGALVSTMKYLPPGQTPDADRDLAELESLLDRVQPGWRDAVVERRWLPSMIASNALVTAAAGGTSGRPGPRVPDAPGVWVVGDWVGGEGMLLDASLASAERAADDVAVALATARVA